MDRRRGAHHPSLPGLYTVHFDCRQRWQRDGNAQSTWRYLLQRQKGETDAGPGSGKLFSGWVGANAGDVDDTGGVYTIVMDGGKAVTANFAAQSCSSVSLTAADDTYLSGGATGTNYGSSTALEVAGSTTTANQRTALLRWAFTIPANTTISSASISLNVTNNSAFAYPLYEAARAWVESAATWTTDGTFNWQTAGASNTTTGSIDPAAPACGIQPAALVVALVSKR